MSAPTPGPWFRGSPYTALTDEIVSDSGKVVCSVWTRKRVHRDEEAQADPEGVANARLIETTPDLLALAHQYATECGDCAGTRITPNGDGGDEHCTMCDDIWLVIDKAEGRS